MPAMMRNCWLEGKERRSWNAEIARNTDIVGSPTRSLE